MTSYKKHILHIGQMQFIVLNLHYYYFLDSFLLCIFSDTTPLTSSNVALTDGAYSNNMKNSILL